MGDDTEATYRDGDIVWVKLGPVWWPGEVVDRSKVPEDITIRKDPIAIVKFFEEDSYEVVRVAGNIKYYSCSKKHDFIRKGIASYKNEQMQLENSPLKSSFAGSSSTSRRSKGDTDVSSPGLQREKQNKMENFPKHVCIAESLTGGNPDILSDPEIVPQKKIPYAAAIFGPPVSQKKKVKGTPGRKSKGGTPGKRTSNSDLHLTRHRRFLGYDDHEVRILIQKPRQEQEEEEEDMQMYNCQDCGFRTPRVEVIMMHKKSHLKGVYTAFVTKSTAAKTKTTQEQVKKSPTKKPRKSMSSLPKTKTTTIDEDIELLQKGLSIFEEKNDATKEKEPPVVSKPPNETGATILKSILCEWDNDFEDEKEEEVESPKVQKVEENAQSEAKKAEDGQTSKRADNSCFDFSEEEEGESEVVAATKGRKIPRVIPDAKEKTEEEKKEESNDAEFLELMEATAVPKIPEVSSSLKCEQNFRDGAMKKFPDKPELPDPPATKPASPIKEVATKLTNPKKRFVKSFEDFAAKYLQQAAEESNNTSSSITESSDREISDKSISAENTAGQERTEVMEKKEEPEKPVVTSESEEKELQMGSPESCVMKNKDEKNLKTSITNQQEGSFPEGTSQELSDKESLISAEDEKLDKIISEENMSSESCSSSLKSPEKMVSSSQEDDSVNSAPSPKKSLIKLRRSPLKFPEQRFFGLRDGADIDKKVKDKSPLKVTTSPLKSPPQKCDKGINQLTGKKPIDFNKSPTEQQTLQKKEVDTGLITEFQKSPSKSSPKSFSLTRGEGTTDRVLSEENVSKKISESLQGSSLKRFFKLHDEESTEAASVKEKSSVTAKKSTEKEKKGNLESQYLEVSKLKTQLMSKLSPKEEAGKKSSKRNISDVLGGTDSETTVIESVQPKYNKGKYKSRVYHMSESNSGLHIAKKRAVTSFEDFLDKKPKKSDVTVSDEEKTVILPQTKKGEDELKLSKEKQDLQELEKREMTPLEAPPPSDQEGLKFEDTADQEVISEEVPMEIETEMLPTTSFETNPQAQMDISALTTLAAVSEMTTTLDTVSKHKPPEAELITLDKNVTIVSEKELADGQVEFANDSPAKPLTLSSFSMDFSDSNSGSCPGVVQETQICSEEGTKKESNDCPKDSEITNQNKVQDTDKSVPTEKSVIKIPQQELSSFDIEEQIPPSIVTTQSANGSLDISLPKTVPSPPVKHERKEQTPTSTRLLEILNDRQKKKESISLEPKRPEATIKTKVVSISPKGLITKAQAKKIVEQKIAVETVSVQKVSSKRDYEDIEDIDKFIIQKKPPPVESEIESPPAKSAKKVVTKSTGGKAKILQQTIITPTGDIIQPEPPQQQVDDNIMFDINSMPIVLSDQILQPDSVDSLPVVISDSAGVSKKAEKTVIIKKSNQQQQQMKLVTKAVIRTTVGKTPPTQTYVKVHASQVKPGAKTQKMYQIGPKVVKSNPSVLTQQGKPGKFIIVPSSSPAGTKVNVEKRMTIARNLRNVSPKQVLTKVPNIVPEPTGNKIMIVTNQQGQQSRVLLTPAQQKLFGYQTSGSKVKSTVIKGSPVQKQVDISTAGTSTISPKTTVQHRQFITSSGQLVTKQQLTIPKIETTKGKKTSVQTQRVVLQSVASPKTTPTHKSTAVVRNQQTTKKVQPVDEALLDQQVQEQLQAIKASGLKSQQTKVEQPRTPLKQPARRSYFKKAPTPTETKQNISTSKSGGTPVSAKPTKSEAPIVPPLAPISPSKKSEQADAAATQVLVEEQPKAEAQQRPLNQLIIQDAQGNQTTITEGQILALPSETVDGQPSTYMLVTLDETGNLTPLNNEALMSLDPNLGLGGDLSNMVLQLDAGNAVIQPQQPVAGETAEKPQKEVQPVAAPVVEKEEEKPPEAEAVPLQEPAVDPNQQFYVADPVTAQKLIESLTEGNADFASLLANAENNSILIHADGQQILINANTDNQMLLTVNTDSATEGTSNPIFAAQPTKSQDILAAALADTDVFQQDQAQIAKVTQAQLSPNSALYPMNVGNVLETSLTLTSPIMTPLEVPSTNSKKIPDDEADILTQVPKNVDLPITITDPNISQTVAQQQVASLIANELQSNLELPLAISDASIVVVTSELSSPSYGYSLPSLDDSVDMNQKGFSSSISMPLLGEDSREGGLKTDDSNQSLDKPASEESKSSEATTTETRGVSEAKPPKKIRKMSSCEDSDMMAEGLCTLGGEMCSSLSEPPPDMFDLTVVTAPFMGANIKGGDDIPEKSPKSAENSGLSEDLSSDLRRNESDVYNPYNCSSEGIGVADAASVLNVDESSCEIPVQPPIVTDLTSKSFDLGESVQSEEGSLKESEEEGSERKRIKVD